MSRGSILGLGVTALLAGCVAPPEWQTADYVLGNWTAGEQDELDTLVDRAADAVESVLRDGVVAAMNQFNVRPRKGASASGESADPSTGT